MTPEPYRGAPHGRPGTPGADPAPHLSLTRLRINRGGYDRLGCYWGIGKPLYQYTDDDGTCEGTLRARDRDSAKAQIRQNYPAATFKR